MHGDDIIATEEEIDFAGAGELVAGIPEREVHDEEEVVVVLVELGAFDGADDIFQIERVEVGIAGVEGFDVCGAGVDDVDPGDGAVLDDASGHGRILATEAQRTQSEIRKNGPICRGRALVCRCGGLAAKGIGDSAKGEEQWRRGLGRFSGGICHCRQKVFFGK